MEDEISYYGGDDCFNMIHPRPMIVLPPPAKMLKLDEFVDESSSSLSSSSDKEKTEPEKSSSSDKGKSSSSDEEEKSLPSLKDLLEEKGLTSWKDLIYKRGDGPWCSRGEEKNLISFKDFYPIYKSRDGPWCPRGVEKKNVELWERYLKQIHDSQGYEVDCYPGACERSSFVPCDFNNTVGKRTYKYYTEMSEECIAKFNEGHDEEPEYKFYDIQHVTVLPTSGHKTFYITFRAYQVADSNAVIKTFRAKFFESIRRGFERRIVLLCELKEVLLSQLKEATEPCTLPCCCKLRCCTK